LGVVEDAGKDDDGGQDDAKVQVVVGDLLATGKLKKQKKFEHKNYFHLKI
jgi:hypothetical protein